jgi:hypothetical protein
LSKDWSRPQPTIARAIVTIHGLERSADIARAIAEVGLARSGLDPDSVLLIEPQFLDDVDVAALHLPADTLHWSHTYAVVGRGEEALTEAGIHVRYVVSSPSSYVYPNP